MAVFSGNGSNTAPSFTFSSDTDTGFFRYDADKLGVVTAGNLRAIFDDSGRFLVNTTSQFITSGEAVSVGGTIVSQVNSTTVSPFYASNNTSDSAGVPFYSMHDGSANRGGLFLDSSTIVKLSGQNGIDLATSTAAPAPTKVRIDNTGDMLIGGTIPSSPNARINSDGSAKFWFFKTISGGRTASTSTTYTVTVSGLQFGALDIVFGGYLNSGQGFIHRHLSVGGYQTAINMYSITTLADASGASFSCSAITKNSSNFTFTITNASATQIGSFYWAGYYTGTGTVTVTVS